MGKQCSILYYRGLKHNTYEDIVPQNNVSCLEECVSSSECNMLNVSGVPPLVINELQYELTVSSVQFSHLNESKELKTTTLDLSVLICILTSTKKPHPEVNVNIS